MGNAFLSKSPLVVKQISVHSGPSRGFSQSNSQHIAASASSEIDTSRFIMFVIFNQFVIFMRPDFLQRALLTTVDVVRRHLQRHPSLPIIQQLFRNKFAHEYR